MIKNGFQDNKLVYQMVLHQLEILNSIENILNPNDYEIFEFSFGFIYFSKATILKTNDSKFYNYLDYKFATMEDMTSLRINRDKLVNMFTQLLNFCKNANDLKTLFGMFEYVFLQNQNFPVELGNEFYFMTCLKRLKSMLKLKKIDIRKERKGMIKAYFKDLLQTLNLLLYDYLNKNPKEKEQKTFQGQSFEIEYQKKVDDFLANCGNSFIK